VPQWQDPVCGILGTGESDPSQRQTMVLPGLGWAWAWAEFDIAGVGVDMDVSRQKSGVLVALS
jgi:hypothetical protein